MIENALSVYCIKYAESVLPESMVFLDGDKNKKIPISFAIYLIKIGNRNILVDAGCDTMPGFEMKYFYSPAFVLREVGLSANDITDIIITHSHHDHIEAVHNFKNAVIHISSLEYESGKKYIPDNFTLNVFKDECIINSKIKIIEWGGHSIGSSIVEINTGNAIHIFAGDECYINANIENKICTGSFYNKDKSIKFVEKYSNKKYFVHTYHDISLKTERIIYRYTR